jgi:MraZ protein
MLRGTYPAKVDSKGRVKIPAAFLEELHERGNEFYVTSDTGDYARIYPMKKWRAIEEKLSGVPSYNKTKQKFLARANYYGQAVTMDKQGRVLIPPVLREAALMKGDVDVSGQLDYIEVWNHARNMERLKAEPMTDDDLKSLADLGI